MSRVLFLSSNGTGLGHLTRSMAIARRLGGIDPFFLTLSGAAPVVRGQGFPVEYVASYSTPGAGSNWRWSRRLRGRLRAVLAELAPELVVFDGAHPYQGLVDALPAARGATRVWCRRAMWKPGSNPGALGRERSFDHVLEPGEFAASQDRGPTVARRPHAHVVDPIVFCADQDLLPRAEAARELGLDPKATCVLINLGQGEEVRALAERCVAHLAGREGVQVAVLSSAIAAGLEPPEGVVHLRATYPISRYYRAIDAAVAACGYNAYHELIRCGVPALYAPMRRETDDQSGRARYAQEVGVGLSLEGATAGARLDQLLDPAALDRMRAKLAELRPGNGADDAARWLQDLVVSERPKPRERTGGWRAHARNLISTAQSDPGSLARMPRELAAIAKQTIERPAARTVVLAVDVPAGGIEAILGDALARTSDPPERVLVATDSLELATLRHAGVGFEHVPARDEPQARLAAGSYEDFVAARLRLILAERRRPQRFIAIGETAEAVVASGTLSG